jgi:hypothetical protein
MRRQIVLDHPDALRLGKVNVSEFAHAGGKVHGGATVGDFDLAPGPMHIEEDEQVGRPIALVFAVVALKLPRLGIEVEHILHAGDVLAVHLRNAPHVLAPGLEVVFGQAPAHGLPGEAVVLGEPDQFTRQQFERPTGAALRRLGQQSFLFARELAVCSGGGSSRSAAARLLSTKRCLVR